MAGPLTEQEAAGLLEGGWLDVSRPLTDDTPVWPGDHPVRLHTEREDWGALSWFEATCHGGTHVDAPAHVAASGALLEEIPLVRLIGRAEVVRPRPGDGLVRPTDLGAGWRPRAPRLLLRTDSYPLGADVAAGFVALAAELVPWLAERGVELVGIDTPSVDAFGAPGLPAHHAMAAHGLTWLENLWLGDVAPGLVLLVALPLRLVGAEAAPVRAVVRPLE